MSLSERIEQFWSAFESGRLDAAFADVIHPDVEFVMPGMPPLRGAAAVRPLFEGWRAAFPDMRHETVHAVESGDTWAAETRYAATHLGPMPTPSGVLPASGKPVRWTSADIVRFDGGRIRSWHVYHDPATLRPQ